MPTEPILNPEEDLTRLSPEDLDALRVRVADRVSELDDADLTDEVVAELESLAQVDDAIKAEQSRRDEQSNQLADRAAAARAKLLGEPADEPPVEGDELVPADAPVPEPVAATIEAVEAPVPAPAAPAAVMANQRAATLTAARPASYKPKLIAPAGAVKFVTTANVRGRDARRGVEIDGVPALAKVLHETWSTMARQPHMGQPEYLHVATHHKDLGDLARVGGDGHLNVPTFTEVARRYRSLVASVVEQGGSRAEAMQEALVASGPCCTPLSPLYDFCRTAEAQTPIEAALPTVPGDRGGIRYIVPPDPALALGAIDINACEAIDPDDSETFKACARVTCPQVEEVTVDAISQCLLFDNLQYRTFPELVENFLEDVAVAFANRKERAYLDFIEANSTAVTDAVPYGASRGLLWDLTTAATAYRKRRGMRRGAAVTVILPDIALDLMKLDMAMDHDEGLAYFNIPDSAVTGALASRGIDVTWANVASTAVSAAPGIMQGPQLAGVLNPWPATVTWYLFNPGAFVRVDGGTLDVGLVRDSTLNRTNDLQIFMEEWGTMAFLCAESIAGTSDVCPSGTGPEPVTPLCDESLAS